MQRILVVLSVPALTVCLVAGGAVPAAALPVRAQATMPFGVTLGSTDDPNPHGRVGYLVVSFQGQRSSDGAVIGPTGTVTVRDGGAVLTTIRLSSATPVVALQRLTVGDHTLTALYSGDQTYPAVTSAPFAQTITASSAQAPTTLAAATAQVWPYARAQWSRAVQDLGSSDPLCFPQESRAASSWVCTGKGTWTAGYFPGAALLASADQGTGAVAAEHDAVEPWLAGMADEAGDTGTQDLGLMLLSSTLVDWRLTGNVDDAAVLQQGAASLDSRFDPTTGVLPSWHHAGDTVGIETDQLPGLPLLLWAADHGGPSTLRDHALGMARIATRDLVRPDGSTWHYANYDPMTGALVSQGQNKGVGDLVWTRGQAWAVDGFAETYAATGDPALLTAARSTAAWWVKNVPAGAVPYSYQDSPSAPNLPSDSSAAAIAALGLLRLAGAEPNAKYAKADRKAAVQTLVRLSGPTYLGGTAGLLAGSRGGQFAGDLTSESGWGDWNFEAALRLANGQ